MKCQSCDNPATVSLTNIVNGQKKVVNLCQECAEKKEILKNQELNLSAILQTVIGQLETTLHRAFDDAQFRKKIESQGCEVAAGTPQDLARVVREDQQKWRKLILEKHITVE